MSSSSDSDGSEDEREYDVERIIGYKSEDSDGDECTAMYLVKWEGYDTDESTWEPGSGLTDPQVKEKIRIYRIDMKKEKLRKLDRDKRKARELKEHRHRPTSTDRRLDQIRSDKQKKRSKTARKEDRDLKDREERKNRLSKGQNAYASGSSFIKKNAYKSGDGFTASGSRAIHEKYKKRALGKQPPKGESAAKKTKTVQNDLIKNIIGTQSTSLSSANGQPSSSSSQFSGRTVSNPNFSQTPRMPATFKKKKTSNQAEEPTSYVQNMNAFYKKKEVNIQTLREQHDVLDEF